MSDRRALEDLEAVERLQRHRATRTALTEWQGWGRSGKSQVVIPVLGGLITICIVPLITLIITQSDAEWQRCRRVAGRTPSGWESSPWPEGTERQEHCKVAMVVPNNQQGTWLLPVAFKTHSRLVMVS